MGSYSKFAMFRTPGNARFRHRRVTLRPGRFNRWLLAAIAGAVCSWAGTIVADELADGQAFRDWSVRCDESTDKAENGTGDGQRCYLYQHLTLRQTGDRLLHVAVSHVPASSRTAARSFSMVFTLPLGIYLPAGIQVAVDEEASRTAVVQQCTVTGCRAVLPLDAETVRQMKEGRESMVSFFDGGRRQISVPVSLMGFTAGFEALSGR